MKTKEELIKEINNLVLELADNTDEKPKVNIDSDEIFADEDEWLCAVGVDTYYMHHCAWAKCGGEYYDMGEDIDYSLEELSAEDLQEVLDTLYAEYEVNEE